MQSEQMPNEAQQGSVSILVLGRSGSGKTYFIDYACQTPRQGENRPSHQGTTDARSRRTCYSGVAFKLIDTPGFDNLTMSDSEILVKIADYLLHPYRIGRGITGIIYIHPASDTLRSRNLLRNLLLLSDLFLGETGLARLTIFVPLTSARGIDPAAIADEMRRPGSVFSPVCAAGAKIMTPGANRPGFIEAMMSYASEDPIVLPIQQDSRSNFLSRLDQSTWHFEGSAQRLVKDLETRYEAKLRELELLLNNKGLELEQYQKAYSEIEQLCASQQGTHIADKLTQGEIVQTLKDLNREIDDIGRLISAHLVDNHVQATFGKDVADVTALDARDLPGLKSLLGHIDGKSSLVASSGGVGMDVESFLDFSIRALLCIHLVTKLFQPFHPGIDSSQDKALLSAYEEIQKQESQSVAGKWRASTFKNIYRPEKEETAGHINALTHEFVRDGLGPLLTLFFGRKDALLERQHFNRLHQLITNAWDWNSKLKGEVVMLGDYEQIGYVPPSSFHNILMEEFEPNPRTPRAECILATLALGLVCRRAIGRGQSPEETVVCKALVATNNLYA